jgi:hypothetical protein
MLIVIEPNDAPENPGHRLVRDLRLGRGRRGEEAASNARDECSSVHHGPSVTGRVVW